MRRSIAVCSLAVSLCAVAGTIPVPAVHADSATTGTGGGKAAALRTSLNTLMAEHVYLAGAATGAALEGRESEFTAAAAALDANSVAFARAIGSVYGAGAESAFLPLWRRHIGFVVDYTVGLATKDKVKQDQAVSDLVGYAQDFGAFLSSANPNLPKPAVAELVKHHVLTLKDVIDAQATKHPVKAYTALRAAAGHMQMIADPLAEAIVSSSPTASADDRTDAGVARAPASSPAP